MNTGDEALPALLEGHPESAAIYAVVVDAIRALGDVELRVGRSQIGFRRRRSFAWLWRPGQHLKGERPPLVLSLGLRRRDGSARWAEVVEPYPGRFTHHLELRSPAQVDDEVRAWLREAWAAAG